MKVKIKVNFGSIHGGMQAGQVVEIPDADAQEYIRLDYAEAYEAVEAVEVPVVEEPAKPAKKVMKKQPAKNPESN